MVPVQLPPQRVPGRFWMDGDDGIGDLREQRHVRVEILDHQVDVQRNGRSGRDGDSAGERKTGPF